LLLSSLHAAAGEIGWLEFADGNRISGELLELTPSGGVLRTQRFGDVTFQSAEATFYPAAAPRAAAAPDATAAADPAAAQDDDPSATTDPLAAVGQTDPDDPPPAWAPVSWSLTGAMMWREEDGDQEYEIDTDLHADWRTARNEATATVRSRLREKNEATDNNEQSARARWFHEISDPWLVTVQFYAERDTVDGTFLRDADYLLLQGTLGFGLQHTWNERAFGRIGLAANRFRLEFLDFDVHGYSSAASVFGELRLQLTEQLSLASWVNFYDWDDTGTGLESESEMEYAITRSLALGLRHRFRENGATLESRELNELKVYTRIRF
jgi:hypothetical protein